MTRRIERVGEIIKQEVSKIILYKLNDPRINLVTVTKVKPSPDLRTAKIYVTMSGNESEQNRTLDILKRAKGYIQSEITLRLKMRFTPSLSFYLDDTERKSSHILKLIEKAVDKDR
ncbi:MAG: 30S ribosome-binding factor RbfA [Candidatus Scalinduaceae bacterium]